MPSRAWSWTSCSTSFARRVRAAREPTLVELRLDKALGRFEVMRKGYDILRDEGER
jgi:hypothetical protein